MSDEIKTSDLLGQAARRLAGASDSPRLDAETLLALVTGHTRAHFYAWPDEPVSDAHTDRFVRLLERRLAGHPIAHLTGRREFWSREFKVTPDVLIPRPETELLVEWALSLEISSQPLRIADLGTGSGVIALTLALECPKAQVLALDVSAKALAIAKDNARRWEVETISFVQSDWLAAVSPTQRFDLIVANPPYVAEQDHHLTTGDVRFEPPIALNAGVDGLDALRVIIAQAMAYLKPGGWLLLEHGYDQGEAVRKLLGDSGYSDIESRPDLQGHPRISGGRSYL